ncbi:hypothetical protein BH11CYA1_BH11CYA1_19590 [soil metagenome]
MSTAKDQKQIAIRAINQLGRRVTAADVATETGLSINDSSRLLNEIASEVGGHLEVSAQGFVAYSFSSGFQNKYIATGLKAFFERVGKLLFDIGFFTVKISFGLLLLTSLAVVIIAVMITIFVTTFGSEKKNKRQPLLDLLILRDLIFWQSTSGRAKRLVVQPLSARVEQIKNDNFLINCFSFLFGDKSPNAEIEEKQWRLIAQLIHNNDGVVIAEQLAPLLLLEIPEKASSEDYVLPVLCRFDGRPEVSDSGSIIYQFPSLQVSAGLAETPQIVLQNFLPNALLEYEIPFSNLTKEQIRPVLAIATLNLAGTWWLAFTAHRLVHIYSWQSDILAIYGTLFAIIPLLRWVFLNWVNAGITMRNAEREKLASKLVKPTADLQEKLNQREKTANDLTISPTIDSASVIYTSEKDYLEQDLDGEKFEEKK